MSNRVSEPRIAAIGFDRKKNDVVGVGEKMNARTGLLRVDCHNKSIDTSKEMFVSTKMVERVSPRALLARMRDCEKRARITSIEKRRVQ